MSEQSGERDELERALTALAPRRTEVDRDRLMYQAGRAAAATRYRRWLWFSGGLTVASGGATALLALALVFTPRPVRVVTVPLPAPAPAPAPIQPADDEGLLPPPGVEAALPPMLPPYSYGRLHQEIVRHGPDALLDPAPLGGAGGAASETPAPPLSVLDWRSRSVDGMFLRERGDD